MRRNLSRPTSAALSSLIRRPLHVAQAALPQKWVFRYYRFPWWVNSTHDSLVESLREGINRRPSLDHTLGTPISPSLCDHRRHRAGQDCDIQCSASLYHRKKRVATLRLCAVLPAIPLPWLPSMPTQDWQAFVNSGVYQCLSSLLIT